MKSKYPQFPLYIVSKGRSQYMTTSKALSKMGVYHYIVVEDSEKDLYQKAINEMNLKAEIKILDMGFKACYNTCDEFGLSKSTGPGPARNFARQDSIDSGYKWHWVMDDNIQGFFRLNHNLKVPCESPAFWRSMEDFCLRYKNVSMAGPNYFFFAPRKTKQPPFVTNTRIYSCNLIRNDVPFIWRGRYNEDTIISLDMMTAGWCTIQFNAFLQDKLETQKQKGGNTGEFYHKEGEVKEGERYAKDGTYLKSKMMVDVYPRLSKIVHKFGRVHHEVNYKPFKKNKLKRVDNYDEVVTLGVDNYGMKLIML